MGHGTKFAIYEFEGEEFGQPNEYRAVAVDIWEDEDYSRDVNGLLYSHPHIVGVGKEVKVPSSQQLINIDGLEIRGQLTLSGSLVV